MRRGKHEVEVGSKWGGGKQEARADFRLPTCDLPLPSSDFPLTSHLHLPLPTSDFTTSDFTRQISNFRDGIHRPQQRRRRILRRLSPRRRCRGDAQYHVGQRRVWLSRRRPGRDAADGSPGARRRRGGRRASRVSRPRGIRPAGAARVAARGRGSGALSDRRAGGDRRVGRRAARAREGARRALQHGGPRSDARRRDRPCRRVPSTGRSSSSACRAPSSSRAGEAAGLRVASEGFADRAYAPDGSLAPRTAPGSVIHDPEEVVRRSLRMVDRRTGHGDRWLDADVSRSIRCACTATRPARPS